RKYTTALSPPVQVTMPEAALHAIVYSLPVTGLRADTVLDVPAAPEFP
ncbi:MAG: hypothetical protein K0Q61_3822, partial [Rhodococcus erythropolis]|nr:hypothetical protein [Rhodococcus erythropolis]